MAKVQTSKRVNAVTLQIDLIYKLDGEVLIDTHLKHRVPRSDAIKLLEEYINRQNSKSNGDA